jgi:cell division protease FtsH
MNRRILSWTLMGFVAVWLLFVIAGKSNDQGGFGDYGSFMAQVRSGAVTEVEIRDREIHARLDDGSTLRTYDPGDPQLVNELLNAGVSLQAREAARPGLLTELLISWFPLLLIVGLWFWFARRNMGGGGNGMMGIGKSRARHHAEGDIKVGFGDVAGCQEAKEDVAELVEFLRNPGRFRELGGRIPRGVLMAGPPGTGKTLLARAIAGEAKVPFFSISGSDFVEMFVGVGASRVRDLFEQAKKAAPCIIFVDEIDAVGRRRGAGMGGGHDEREQTLNQLLVEMDGFEGNEGVIVIAATNRPDVLDPALLRPGRFDRQVTVGLPDIAGRQAILKVHMRKLPVAEGVDTAVIARGTPGFSGADLANLVNEAALFAARANKQELNTEDFERAKDKIMMGAERRSMVMSEEEKALTAYHEAGHAIVGRLVPDHDPVHKVSIVPRGRALGVTLFLPERDRFSLTRSQANAQITSLFGGRVAEALIFGRDKVTTGASNDIQRATELARNMVTRWGLSEKLGPLAYFDDEEEVFLGRSVSQSKTHSGETAKRIDREIRRIIDENYARSEQLLEENKEKLHAMAEALLQYETIDRTQIDAIMAGKPAPAPADNDGGPAGTTGTDGERKAAKPPKAPPIGGPVGEH